MGGGLRALAAARPLRPALLTFVAEQIGVLPDAMDAYLAGERRKFRADASWNRPRIATGSALDGRGRLPVCLDAHQSHFLEQAPRFAATSIAGGIQFVLSAPTLDSEPLLSGQNSWNDREL